MKYYYREHLLGYQRVQAEGKTAWNEIHGSSGFEHFSSRAFVEMALPRLRFLTSQPAALEYGCGTGPGSCFLAGRGFRVDGIDIIPTAIEMAREQARARNLEVRYAVQDICALPHEGLKYDLIVDSYCLQGIVADADRERAFAAVRARLRPEGYYLISTAMFDERRCSEEQVVDPNRGIIYNVYGKDGVIDMRTGIVYKRLEERPTRYKGTIQVEGAWYLLNRRHLKPPALKAELEGAGFYVLYQDGGYGGNVICVSQAGYSPERSLVTKSLTPALVSP